MAGTAGLHARRDRESMATFQAGLEHSMMAGRMDAVVIYVNDKLMRTSEEGQMMDMGQITRDVAGITELLGSSLANVGATMALRGAAIQPVMLA